MNFTGMLALTEKETTRFIRIWTQTIIPPLLTSVLFILIFGVSLGSQIKEMGGVGYIQFILPGLLMMGVILSAYSNTSTSLFISKFQGSVQELLLAPLSYWEIIVAYTIAGVLRGILVGVGVLLVGILFAQVTVFSYGYLLYFIIMISLLFCFAGIATGLWATNFDKMMVFATFLITPLTWLGGVFYSIHTLPPLWQHLARLNPILYMVDGFRYSFLGRSDVWVGYSAVMVLVLTVGFFWLCVWMFKKGYKLRS